MKTKRVTVTVELIDQATDTQRERVIWSTTESAEYSTGGNPRFHADDMNSALTTVSASVIDAAVAKYGEPPEWQHPALNRGT